MKKMFSFSQTAAAFLLAFALLFSAFPLPYAAMQDPENAQAEEAATADGETEPIPEEDEEKVLCTATIDDDFEEGIVLVVIKKAHSEVNKPFTPEDFPEIECTEVEDLMSFDCDPNDLGYLNQEQFHQILKIKLAKPGKQAVLDAIQQLETNPIVKNAEPNAKIPMPESELPTVMPQKNLMKPFSMIDSNPEIAAIPNDPKYSEQYALRKINAPAAWNITTGSHYVRVGVIDTGIASHPDLACNLRPGWDYFNSNGTTTDDRSGHGTHVAGIIGATGNNGDGISGVNWHVSLYPLQVLDDDGKCDLDAIVASIKHAIRNDFPILNKSIEPCTYSLEADAIQNYSGLIVCAAGNYHVNWDTSSAYPPYYKYENVICVAATNDNDRLWVGTEKASNYGGTTVDLAAPGDGILSTVPGDYESWSGTSMAAPFVTGVAALIKSIRPDLSAEQIKDCIVSSVDKVSALNGKVKSGGRLNAYNALVTAQYYTPDTVLCGDFDGDNVDEEMIISYVGGYRTKFYFRDNGAASLQLWHTATGFVKANCANRWDVGDFNGDGKDDIACFYDYGDNGGAHSAILVFLSNGGGFNAFQKWHEETISYPLSGVGDRFTAGDFDGDGKTDIATMYDYGNSATKIHIFRSNGSNFGGTWLGWYQDMKTYNASKVGCRFEAGDFNGDGKDDLVAMYDYSTASTPYLYGLHVFRSSGQGLEDWQAWRPVSTGYNLDNIGNRFATGDFNGDGKDDVATMYQYDSTTAAIHVFTSSGSGFADWTTWYKDTAYPLGRASSFAPFQLRSSLKCGLVVRYNYLDETKGTPYLHTFIPGTNSFSYNCNDWAIKYPPFSS